MGDHQEAMTVEQAIRLEIAVSLIQRGKTAESIAEEVVTISKVVIGEEAPAPTFVAMPNLVGTVGADAIATLEALGIQFVYLPYAADVATWRVYAQGTLPGSEVPLGHTVVLTFKAPAGPGED